jgi:hypothetical protein
MRARFVIAGCAGALALVSIERSAHADTASFITVGGLFSYVGGRHPAAGLGGEASFMYYERSFIGLGPFAQAQSYFGSGRYAFGLQVGSIVGLEGGMAYRSRDETHREQWGGHVGVYGSLGVVSLAVRGTIPVGAEEPGALPRQGGELGFALGLKIPIPIGHGHDDWFRMPSGRALRDHDRTLRAQLAFAAEDHAIGAPFVADLDDASRASLARYWSRIALDEHASIASFERLALELRELDAPGELIARATRAADEERRHAELTFAIASAYAGAPLEPGALEAPAREASLEVLAREALVDGVLGEGLAAKAARWARAHARDPFVRSALGEIARDEARHAELSWSILAFAVGRESSLARVVSDALIASERDQDDVARLEAQLIPHGHVPIAVIARLARATRASATHRLSKLRCRDA